MNEIRDDNLVSYVHQCGAQSHLLTTREATCKRRKKKHALNENTFERVLWKV